jgi:nicotinamide riboside kinase
VGIAKGQISAEDLAAAGTNKLLICDTSLEAIKMRIELARGILSICV